MVWRGMMWYEIGMVRYGKVSYVLYIYGVL